MLKYTGRFAPSPTGPLHMGSLVTALASFLDARHHQGRWLLRIDDIDPPRSDPKSLTSIPAVLGAHGLCWDGDIIWQSQHLSRYRDVAQTLIDQDHAYGCSCTRARVAELKGIYDGKCSQLAPLHSRLENLQGQQAVRFRSADHVTWQDLVQGQSSFSKGQLGGDFIIWRRDGLVGYQLACALDDAENHITHIIRGVDLHGSCARQLLLLDCIGVARPDYGHIPVLADSQGIKLSKQTGAMAIDPSQASQNLCRAATVLGLPQESIDGGASITDLLTNWIKHWRLPAPSQLFESTC